MRMIDAEVWYEYLSQQTLYKLDIDERVRDSYGELYKPLEIYEMTLTALEGSTPELQALSALAKASKFPVWEKVAKLCNLEFLHLLSVNDSL